MPPDPILTDEELWELMKSALPKGGTSVMHWNYGMQAVVLPLLRLVEQRVLERCEEDLAAAQAERDADVRMMRSREDSRRLDKLERLIRTAIDQLEEPDS